MWLGGGFADLTEFVRFYLLFFFMFLRDDLLIISTAMDLAIDFLLVIYILLG
jgi:hypothetical protein